MDLTTRKECIWIEHMMLMLSLSAGIVGIEELQKDHKGERVVITLSRLPLPVLFDSRIFIYPLKGQSHR